MFLFSVYLVAEMEILSWELGKKKFLTSYDNMIRPSCLIGQVSRVDDGP